MKTIVISDIHLGSPLARSKELRKFLKEVDFDRLIVNGDIFCDLNFSRLRKSDLHLLRYLSKLSKKKQVILIEGNHDAGLVKILEAFGIEAHEQYEFWWNGKCCIVLHGHQFDGVVTGYPALSRLLGFLFVEAQKIPLIPHRLAVLVDKVSGKWQRLGPKVAERALKFAKHHQYDVIFCGHTHDQLGISDGFHEYYNSGCWCEEVCGYIEINEKITLKQIGEKCL